MHHDSPHMKDFQEILDGEAFDALVTYKNEASWQTMSSEEREMLAYLFVRLGEQHLQSNTGDFKESFELALKIAPRSANIYYFQGEALLNHVRDANDLTYACKVIEEASKIFPGGFDIWWVWAVILTRLGAMEEEPLYFQEALAKFSEAEKCAASFPPEQLGNFYYDWGQAWFFIGKLSGEALDFKNALSMYQRVAQYDFPYPSFWLAYGDAMIELAFLIGKTELFYEAADFYARCLKHDKSLFQGWLNLGCAYQMIFEIGGDETFYFKAAECFKQAEASPKAAKSAILWLKWGKLMTSFAKMKNDPNLLEASLDKFAKADAIEPDEPLILSRWGEAQMILGSGTERVHLLKEAQQKILRSVELDPQIPEGWYLSGVCLNELGRYFNDLSFYEKAIEKFQTGLSLNQADSLLWFGIAAAHYALGDARNDQSMVEKALKFYPKVFELGGIGSPQFWNDWGVALMRLAEITNEQSYLEAAIEKFERIIRLQEETNVHEVELEWLYNYGCALDFLGDFTESEASYEKAIQVLSYIVQQDPDYYHARYNLALALSHLGETVSDPECLQKACEQFEILLAADPEDEIAWCDWGLAQMHQAQLIYEPIRPESSQRLYEQAENKFLHAVALGSFSAYYHLGCLSALLENYPRAMLYLERAKASEALPTPDDLLHDEWLEGLRQTHEFRTFLSQIMSRQEKK